VTTFQASYSLHLTFFLKLVPDSMEPITCCNNNNNNNNHHPRCCLSFRWQRRLGLSTLAIVHLLSAPYWEVSYNSHYTFQFQPHSTFQQNAQPCTSPICPSPLTHSYPSAPSSCVEKTVLAIHVPIHHTFPTTLWSTMRTATYLAKAPCSTLETIEAVYEALGTVEEHIEGSGSTSVDIHQSCTTSSRYPN
jgi:hypothetical protein